MCVRVSIMKVCDFYVFYIFFYCAELRRALLLYLLSSGSRWTIILWARRMLTKVIDSCICKFDYKKSIRIFYLFGTTIFGKLIMYERAYNIVWFRLAVCSVKHRARMKHQSQRKRSDFFFNTLFYGFSRRNSFFYILFFTDCKRQVVKLHVKFTWKIRKLSLLWTRDRKCNMLINKKAF